MRNIERRHKFPLLFPGRSLKKIVPAAILALLASPIQAAELKPGATY